MLLLRYKFSYLSVKGHYYVFVVILRSPTVRQRRFKQLSFLLNYKTDVDETLQGCSLHKAFLNCSKNFMLCRTLVALTTKMKKKTQTIFFLDTTMS